MISLLLPRQVLFGASKARVGGSLLLCRSHTTHTQSSIRFRSVNVYKGSTTAPVFSHHRSYFENIASSGAKAHEGSNERAWVALPAAMAAIAAFGICGNQENQNGSHQTNRNSVKCEAAATVAAAAVASRRHSFLDKDAAEEDMFLKKGYTTINFPPRFSQCHAVFGTLLAPGLVERYNVYTSPVLQEHAGSDDASALFDQELVVADIYFGKRINGHEGIVHGGIAALFFDDVFGFGCYQVMRALNNGKTRKAYTANLSTNYRKPLEENTRVVLRVKLTKVEGRKMSMYATLTSSDGSVVYSDATALYIIARE
jgi:acyl-coenzyme A thioesterase PaaI-like protein